jgi:hypothetical protein
MSKRRQAGDIVWKKTNAGFIGKRLPIILENDEGYPCLLACGDEDCREWANCEIVEDTKGTGKYCYHVSECEMEDYDIQNNI